MKTNNVMIERLKRNAMADARPSEFELITEHPSGVTTDESFFGNDTSLLCSAPCRSPG